MTTGSRMTATSVEIQRLAIYRQRENTSVSYNVSVLTCAGNASLALVQLNTRVEHDSVFTRDWLKSWWNAVSWDARQYQEQVV